MVMLNNKTYAPSSYVGSPRFTRMEKTARTMFSDGEKYPTTKVVRLLVRNMVFFELFLCYFSRLSMLFYPPPHIPFSQFHSSRKHKTRAIDPMT